MRDLLRDVDVDGYRLTLWDTGRSDSLGKSRLAYRLTHPDGRILFEGDGFFCSPLHCVDSDETLRAVLGFLTLRPGDTDREYFDNYTPEQLAWAQAEAEALSLWTLDPEEGFEFQDWKEGE